MSALKVVTAYYLDRASLQLVSVLPQNALIREDMVQAWDGLRSAAKAQYGWEILVSPPNDPADSRSADGYTKAMFRTPEDQGLMVAERGDGAAPVDSSPHQAGSAFDVDLEGMAAAFPNWNADTFAGLAQAYGWLRRVASEPWHYDDNPASKFSGIQNAIAAVGNLSSQVTAAVAAGQKRPEAEAVAAYGFNNTLKILGLLGVVAGAVYLGKKKEPSNDELRQQRLNDLKVKLASEGIHVVQSG